MSTTRRQLLSAGAASLATTALPVLAQQSAYPTKPVHFMVPFPPGGAADGLARVIADKLSERWKQPVTVENKPGANTMLGTDVVAKSAPDGHVLGMVTGSHVINPLLTNKMPYDSDKDVTGVMALTRIQLAVFAHPSLPANNPTELFALARREGGKLAYASATTQSFLGMELLAQMAGIKWQYVAYKGSAQALNDLIGGHIQVMIDPIIQSTLEHVKAGRIKLIGTLGATPAEQTPNAPLFASVVKGWDYSGVFGLIAQGNTPPELVRRIRNEFVAVMTQPAIAERIKAVGQEYVGSTPQEYNTYIQTERKKWAPIVKSTGATLE